MGNFKYSKIEVLVKANKPQEFIGSQIRGALGYSLKKVTCINPSFTCNECFASSNCLYYDFYEKLNTYHKYRLDFNIKDNLFAFNIYLYEDVSNKIPYLLSALHKLLKENGLGRDRVKFDDFYFYVDGKEVYDGKKFNIPKDYIKTFEDNTYTPDISLKLQTPLRIKKDNKFIKEENFEVINLLNSIYQRQRKLTDQDSKKLPFEPTFNIETKNLYHKKLTRFSNRQKTKMNMDGLMGEVIIKNIDKDSYELLKLGEIIGAGKQTVMGLGKIEIKDLHE